MKKEDAIKYLQQLYPNGGHCWLDEQRIEAISMAINALQEEPVSDIDFEQELYKAFGQVKDFTLGMQIAKRFYDMGKNNQEPVSERFAFKAIPRLLEMIEPTDRAKAYIAKLADTLELEGYSTDAKIVMESLKIMNGEKVAMATMDEEPVSEDLEEAMQHNAPNNIGIDDLLYWRNGFITGANWQKEKDESATDDLGNYINELSKQFPEVSFAKLSRIAVRVANWQKENLWKPADGDDLPIIDREVIVLLNNGRVTFGHRPPEYWDGKDIITGKVTRNYVERYDKGLWNLPNVKYWLDVELPKEIEL